MCTNAEHFLSYQLLFFFIETVSNLNISGAFHSTVQDRKRERVRSRFTNMLNKQNINEKQMCLHCVTS